MRPAEGSGDGRERRDEALDEVRPAGRKAWPGGSSPTHSSFRDGRLNGGRNHRPRRLPPPLDGTWPLDDGEAGGVPLIENRWFSDRDDHDPGLLDPATLDQVGWPNDDGHPIDDRWLDAALLEGGTDTATGSGTGTGPRGEPAPWCRPDQGQATGAEPEPLPGGGTHLLDLIAAVDHLARGLRHDFTVWDALEEALAWWLTDQATVTSGAPNEEGPPSAVMPREVEARQVGDDDLLGLRLTQLARHLHRNPSIRAADTLQQAVRHWVTTMATNYNAGHHWPHPPPRRGFPPPRLDP